MERLVLSWVGKPLAFDLMPGLNRLGRNPTNDFRIGDASISGFHCELTLERDNRLHVRDLASTNGTYIDGVQIADAELRPGQMLRLGTVELQLEKVTVAEPVHTPEPVLAGGGLHDNSESWKITEKPAKQSLFGKLTQTLKIPFTR
jgi:pSer/pThr/pTyr-binding forkhead associated (FHA) protein